jgi:hypothetical protein
MNWINKFAVFGIVSFGSLAIATSASARFVVFVAGNDAATLQRVRTVSPSAFATKFNDQPVTQAGIFSSEISADSLAISLQQAGLTAQKYFKPSGGKETSVQVPFSDAPRSVVVAPQQVVIQPEPQAVVSSNVVQAPVQYQQVQYQQVQYQQPQYQQVVSQSVVPQVQTQQVLVPRWQQVMVPETRQVVTQTIVPQTQLVQTGIVTAPTTYQTGYQSGYVQPVSYTEVAQAQTSFIQPQTSFIQPQTSFIQPQTSFTQPVLPTYSETAISTTIQAPASNETLIPQATQNPNFRYVAAVPAIASNQFLLSRVRQHVPSAFISNSGRGTYIHAGAYQSRDAAESVSRYLRSQGLDSRVLYF